MKNLLSLVFIVLFGAVAFAQPVPQVEETPKEGPTMTFESMTVDYGDIAKNSDPIRKMTFTNTGTQPLLIKHAKGSCGCTVPTWPKEPIMPGESSEITIRYDTKRVGTIRKTVKITTNEGGDPHVLQIRGKISAEEQPEPLPTIQNGLIDG